MHELWIISAFIVYETTVADAVRLVALEFKTLLNSNISI